MNKKIIFNDWTLFSEDFDFEVFSNGSDIVVKEGTNARNPLFEGKIEPTSISIYDLSSYSCTLEIEYFSKVIKIVKYEEEFED